MSTARLPSYKRVIGYSLSLYPLTLFLHTKLTPDMKLDNTWLNLMVGVVVGVSVGGIWAWQTTCKNVESKNKVDWSRRA